jgi:N-acetylglucosamine kinase-like BadF-type ATPase
VMSLAGRRCVLGVDGGGSGTRCVVIDASGKVLSRSIGGPSNPLTAGFDGAAEAITAAVETATERAGVEAFSSVCLGIAGTDRPSGRNTLMGMLNIPSSRVRIVTDATVALAGATGGGPGVIVISGTGSIALGMNEDGETARAGGWGWRLGDEGSGYFIGSRALISALRAHDGRNRPTLLSERIAEQLNLGDLSGLIDRVYVEGMSVGEVAALAPIVGEAASVGDEEAESIMREAGVELGNAAIAVMERLGLGGRVRIAYNGSVFKLGGALLTSFVETVRGARPSSVIGPPRFEAGVGAAMLAFRDLGVELDEGLLDRIEVSLEELGFDCR